MIKNIFNINKTLFILLALITFNTDLKAVTIHSIIVCDSNVPIDNDNGVIKDLNRVREEVVKLGFYTEKTTKETVFFNLEDPTIFSSLNDYMIDEEDIVLLYLNDHQLGTDLSENGERKEAEFEYLTNVIKTKNPKLFIALADYNSDNIKDINYQTDISSSSSFQKEIQNHKKANYKALFLDKKGFICIKGYSPRRTSPIFGYDNGGSFTHAFFENLYYEVNDSSHPFWDIVIMNTGNKVRK